MNTMYSKSSLFAAVCIVFFLYSNSARAGWTNQSWVMNQSSAYFAVSSLDDAYACAVGLNQVGGQQAEVLYVCTTDGQTWEKRQFTALATSVFIHSADVSFIGTAFGQIWKSADGGNSFSKVEGALAKGEIMEFSTGFDPVNVGAITDQGNLLFSTDSGATFEILSATMPAGEVGARSLDIGAGTDIWIAGGDSGEEPSEGDDMQDPSEGRPAGSGFVLFSSDSGQSFETLVSDLPYCVFDIDFVNSKEGWIAGGGGDYGDAVIAWTGDGGKTWTPVTPPSLPDDERGLPEQTEGSPAICSGVEFFGSKVGLAFCSTSKYDMDGYNGLYLTGDGGRTWKLETGYLAGFDTQPVLRGASRAVDVTMPDCRTAWVVGEMLLIHRYDADDQKRDCEAGGAEGDDAPAAQADAGSDGGGEGSGARRSDGDCGCRMIASEKDSGSGALLHSTLLILGALL